MDIPKTRIGNDGVRYHDINDVNIECSGRDCTICNQGKELTFGEWENSIPYKLPPKGKRYVSKVKQKNRGKSILEICYTCKKIPCYICKRTKCKKWMKEEHRKGQEKGCVSWYHGRCLEFYCDKGIVKTHWEER
jgi:hypothetical protein